MADLKAQLPKTADDGATVVDLFGNVYEFDAHTNSWIDKGIITDPDIVTETSDGLITPEIYNKLKLIEKLKDAGVSFESLKIFIPELKEYPYFYNLRSGHRSIIFNPTFEYGHDKCDVGRDKRICVDIDKGAIYRRLLRTCCVGPKDL